jgi:hypothetical protein
MSTQCDGINLLTKAQSVHDRIQLAEYAGFDSDPVALIMPPVRQCATGIVRSQAMGRNIVFGEDACIANINWISHVELEDWAICLYRAPAAPRTGPAAGPGPRSDSLSGTAAHCRQANAVGNAILIMPGRTAKPAARKRGNRNMMRPSSLRHVAVGGRDR